MGRGGRGQAGSRAAATSQGALWQGQRARPHLDVGRAAAPPSRLRQRLELLSRLFQGRAQPLLFALARRLALRLRRPLLLRLPVGARQRNILNLEAGRAELRRPRRISALLREVALRGAEERAAPWGPPGARRRRCVGSACKRRRFFWHRQPLPPPASAAAPRAPPPRPPPPRPAFAWPPPPWPPWPPPFAPPSSEGAWKQRLRRAARVARAKVAVASAKGGGCTGERVCSER